MKKLLFLLLIPVFTNSQPPSQSRSSREIRDVFFEGNYVHYIINTVIDTSLCQKIELGKPCPSAHIDFDEEEVFKLVGIPASFIDKEIFRNLYNAKSGMILLKSQNIEHRELAKADKFSVISYPVEYQRTYLVKNKKGLIGIKSNKSSTESSSILLLGLFFSGIIFYAYKILRTKDGGEMYSRESGSGLSFLFGMIYVASAFGFLDSYYSHILHTTYIFVLVTLGMILRVFAMILNGYLYPRIFALIELFILCALTSFISWSSGVATTGCLLCMIPFIVTTSLLFWLIWSRKISDTKDQGWYKISKRLKNLFPVLQST